MPKTEVPNRFQAAVCSSLTYLSNATFRLIIESNGGGIYIIAGPLSLYPKFFNVFGLDKNRKNPIIKNPIIDSFRRSSDGEITHFYPAMASRFMLAALLPLAALGSAVNTTAGYLWGIDVSHYQGTINWAQVG